MTSVPPRASRRLVVVAVTILAVLLPALVAGAGIERPAGTAERARAAAAAADPRGEVGGVADLFYAPFADDAAGADAPRARLGSLLGMLAISGLLYAAVAQARGRGQAVLCCFALAATPPVVTEGAIVRPEVPATVFATLALAILVGLPVRLSLARRSRRVGAWAVVFAMGVAVGTAEGLSVASLPALGVHLLVPAGCLLIVVVQTGIGYLQVLRRFRLLVLPSRAFALRIAPWLCAAFTSLLAGALLLRRIGSPPEPTSSAVGLLTGSPWGVVPIVVLAVVGGGVWLFALGLRLGRRRRLAGETVLAVFVIALVVYHIKAGAREDALPSAPALAVLVAEGARVALLFLGAGLNRAARG